jgi:hypothetical protein
VREVLAWHEASLATSGWDVFPSPTDEPEPYVFGDRGGTLLLVVANDGCEGTCVAIARAGGGTPLAAAP